MKGLFKAALVVSVLSLACVSHASPEDTGNIRVSALALLAGYVNVDADWKMDDYWTLGPSFTYWNWRDKTASDTEIRDEIKLLGIGARGNYYFNGAYNDGWYASGFLQYNRLQVTATSGSGSSASWATATVGGLRPGILGGYHWFWDSFNLNVGAGVQAFIGKDKVLISDSSGNNREVATRVGAGLALDLMMGWTF